jgi:uncharacterized protein with FMN-binding domain
MKRAAIVTGMTAVGVALVLAYKVTPHSSGLAAEATPTADPGNSQSAPSPVPSGPASPTPAPTGATGTFTGQDVPNRFGDVQVQVVVANGRITDVKALQLPSDRAQSAYISQVAGPLLRTEALQAQNARIDIISGATYTSTSYAQSLDSALQQAHGG